MTGHDGNDQRGSGRNNKIPRSHVLFILAVHLFTTLTWDQVVAALRAEFNLTTTGAPWNITAKNARNHFSKIKSGSKNTPLGKEKDTHDTLVRGELLRPEEDALVRGFVTRHGQGHLKDAGASYLSLARANGANPANTSQTSRQNQLGHQTSEASPHTQIPMQQQPQIGQQIPQHRPYVLPQGGNIADTTQGSTSNQPGYRTSRTPSLQHGRTQQQPERLFQRPSGQPVLLQQGTNPEGMARASMNQPVHQGSRVPPFHQQQGQQQQQPQPVLLCPGERPFLSGIPSQSETTGSEALKKRRAQSPQSPSHAPESRRASISRANTSLTMEGGPPSRAPVPPLGYPEFQYPIPTTEQGVPPRRSLIQYGGQEYQAQQYMNKRQDPNRHLEQPGVIDLTATSPANPATQPIGQMPYPVPQSFSHPSTTYWHNSRYQSPYEPPQNNPLAFDNNLRSSTGPRMDASTSFMQESQFMVHPTGYTQTQIPNPTGAMWRENTAIQQPTQGVNPQLSPPNWQEAPHLHEGHNQNQLPAIGPFQPTLRGSGVFNGQQRQHSTAEFYQPQFASHLQNEIVEPENSHNKNPETVGPSPLYDSGNALSRDLTQAIEEGQTHQTSDTDPQDDAPGNNTLLGDNSENADTQETNHRGPQIIGETPEGDNSSKHDPLDMDKAENIDDERTKPSTAEKLFQDGRIEDSYDMIRTESNDWMFELCQPGTNAENGYGGENQRADQTREGAEQTTDPLQDPQLDEGKVENAQSEIQAPRQQGEQTDQAPKEDRRGNTASRDAPSDHAVDIDGTPHDDQPSAESLGGWEKCKKCGNLILMKGTGCLECLEASRKDKN